MYPIDSAIDVPCLFLKICTTHLIQTYVAMKKAFRFIKLRILLVVALAGPDKMISRPGRSPPVLSEGTPLYNFSEKENFLSFQTLLENFL